MTPTMLWLQARRLRQFLVICACTGLAGAWIGESVSPVPGQLFADVAGVPLVYLSPVVLAVSLAQWSPTGEYWFETEPAPRRTVITLAVGYALAVGPPLLVSRATEVCLVSARDTLLLAALVLCLRMRWTSAAASATVLVPNFVVWTFGWSESGQPQGWALLLSPSSAGGAAAVTLTLLIVALDGTRRLRPQ